MMFSRGFALACVVFIHAVLAGRAEQYSGFEISTVEDEAVDDEVASSTVLLLQLKSDPQLPPQPLPPILGAYPSGLYAQDEVKRQSMEEANLTCSKVSFYGAAAPKVPESIVESVIALKNEMGSSKTCMYNFQGSVYCYAHHTARSRRHWVLDFAESEFSDADILLITDAPANHTPLGLYDHSNERDAYRPKDHSTGDRNIPFDAEYYKVMIQSYFTLCPGGDSAWSMRFYESILAGSIPVIDTVRHALHHDDVAFWFDRIGYTYFTVDQMADMSMTTGELESIVDNNYKLMLKYQTWTQGDNVPPLYADYKMPCDSAPVCHRMCNSRVDVTEVGRLIPTFQDNRVASR
mmetsp:Transcript_51926/g.111002  ORF Transcript_51926/g.111002 Transcript_51926/m.111002 type:complete len:349 (+) Transcript_51926:51-1097(+)